MNKIICGDALATLKTLESGIVQTCCTSPPYFGLRSYIADGHPDKPLEIGLEDTPELYIARLVEVFREVKRVLRDDGTLWCVIGDSYAGSWGNYAPGGIKGVQRSRTEEGERWERKAYQDTTFLPPTARVKGLKPKDLIGIPWMLAFALRADGWYLRSDIIWSKPNCMPESVTDRPTKSHEYIFLLSKSERYYYDALAIAENATRPGDIQTFGGNKGRNYTPAEDDPNYRYGKEQWGRTITMGNTRNKRSVWTVSTSPFSGAHFATFPPKLIEPMILAGTSPRACEHCGAPWERVTSQTTSFEGGSGKAGRTAEEVNSRGKWAGKQYGTNLKVGPVVSVDTLGWQPTCSHTNDGTAQCIVLDPFAGAGTVPLVSIQHHRAYIGIELNPEYIKLINDRIAVVQPDLWDTAGILSVVRKRIDEATPEEADEIIASLDALIEERTA